MTPAIEAREHLQAAWQCLAKAENTEQILEVVGVFIAYNQALLGLLEEMAKTDVEVASEEAD